MQIFKKVEEYLNDFENLDENGKRGCMQIFHSSAWIHRAIPEMPAFYFDAYILPSSIKPITDHKFCFGDREKKLFIVERDYVITGSINVYTTTNDVPSTIENVSFHATYVAQLDFPSGNLIKAQLLEPEKSRIVETGVRSRIQLESSAKKTNSLHGGRVNYLADVRNIGSIRYQDLIIRIRQLSNHLSASKLIIEGRDSLATGFVTRNVDLSLMPKTFDLPLDELGDHFLPLWIESLHFKTEGSLDCDVDIVVELLQRKY